MMKGNRCGISDNIFRAALCLLLVAAAGLVCERVTGGPSYAAARCQEKSADVTRVSENRTTVRRSDGDHDLEMTAEGDIQYTDDDSDVQSIYGRGHLLIKESRGGSTRMLEVVGGADGRPRRSYFVRGQARAFDQDARAWLANILPGLIRGSGANAAARVRRILGQRGVDGVLEEIALIDSDGVRRIYFDQLLSGSQLDDAALSRIARRAALSIASDGEKANLLIDHARLYMDRGAAAADYFDAVGTIGSDGERARVLSSLLERGLSPANYVRVLKSAKSLSSDGEKANLLVAAARLVGDDQTALSAIYDAARTISSDGEKQRVMSALEQRRRAAGRS